MTTTAAVIVILDVVQVLLSSGRHLKAMEIILHFNITFSTTILKNKE